MKPLNISEWAEALALGSDTQVADYARQVLEMLEGMKRLEMLESEVIEPMMKAAPDQLAGDEYRGCDWLIERHNLLAELEETLADNGYPVGYDNGGTDGALAKVLDDLGDLRVENEALKAPETVGGYDL
jgi:hypothetical protein